MKRFWMLAALFLSVATTASAQKFIVVNSEKIFTSIDAYNKAISTLNDLGEQYQKQVDAKYQEVETLYNNYVAQKAGLSQATQQSRENDILAKEQAAAEFQESIFGQDGTLMKKRLELIQPIQKQVFDAIDTYAKANGIDLVLDAASNPTLLFNSTAIDRTDAVIKTLK